LQSLATHTGTNGSGDVGVPAAGTILSNLGFLFSAATPLFFLLAIYAFILVAVSLARLRFRAQELDRLRPVLLATSIVIGAQIAVTLKNVGDHYLLPAMMVCALANGCIVLWADRISQRRLFSATLPIGVASALVLGVFAAGKTDYQQAIALRAYVGETLAFDQLIPPDAIVVGYYRTSLPGYALAFGNYFAGDRYGSRLRELYPNVLFYDIWRGQFYSFVADVADDEVTSLLRSGKTILLYGTPFVGSYEVFHEGLVTESVLVQGDKALYRLVGISRRR
jgi:hypothetical protein